jgi:hydroxyacylglutathione hydrolase
VVRASIFPEVGLSQPLEIVRFVQGPAQTNAYLIGEAGGSAVVVDPAWDGEVIVRAAEQRGWRITNIWLTHAHFDHFGGAAGLDAANPTRVPVALHPDDHPLWRINGGAGFFGVEEFDSGPEPEIPLLDGMSLHLGDHTFEVIHTPGHTPGHVVLLNRPEAIMLCGDLIFQGSIGRFDLPGGDGDVLLASIERVVLSLPDDVRLLPGHGPETTVGDERLHNPFLQGM